jgi:hypothetical protein
MTEPKGDPNWHLTVIAELLTVIAELRADNEQLRKAMAELLSGHDNLYIAHFGPTSNPRDDIAAKPARRALEAK